VSPTARALDEILQDANALGVITNALLRLHSRSPQTLVETSRRNGGEFFHCSLLSDAYVTACRVPAPPVLGFHAARRLTADNLRQRFTRRGLHHWNPRRLRTGEA